jgi:predicted ATPase
MYKIPISGGPSTGKSTIFDTLTQKYPDAHFVYEAAEIVIKRELTKQKEEPGYEPIMPVTNYRKFAPLVMAQQKENEDAIPEDADLVIMDRCVIDNLGYLAYNGITDYVSEVNRRARAANYTMAFFCDWLGFFEQTEVRRETEEQGLAIHRHLESAYHSSNINVIHLPAATTVKSASIANRLQIIESNINNL